jgi:hypothetical protein
MPSVAWPNGLHTRTRISGTWRSVSEKAVRPPTPTPPQLSGSLRRSDGRGGGSTLSERRAALVSKACTTNGPRTPPVTGQHRPRKRGRRQAGRRRHWERGVARGLAEAPRRRVLSLSLCVAGVGGGREAQTPGATVGRCYKSLPNSILWLRATLLFTFWSRSSLWTRSWTKVNKTDVAPARPPRPGTWTAAGGGTAPRSFDSPKSCARPDSLSRISHERE